MLKIINMTSDRGNSIANQFIIQDKKQKTFQSYKTRICRWNAEKETLILNANWWDYSNTTRKYFKKFINEETTMTYYDKKVS